MSKSEQFVDKINNLVENLPGYVLIKDLDSRYIAASEEMPRLLGFANLADMLGKTDGEKNCPAALKAKDFRQEDLNLIQNDIPISSVAHLDYAEGQFSCIYHKWLIHDDNGLPQAIVVFNQPFEFRNRAAAKSHGESNYFKLSKQQLKCLKLLLRGNTYHRISQELSLSPRTVESYINEIKVKMNCHKKSQIIETALKFGYSV